MSQVYNLEPPTRGQVVLHTSHGDVEIELWPKEAPKAVRNFTQLCMEGYYDSTIFHRVIKDFMIQGGDPSGTGSGGESIYGRQFKSEFHSRLKFNRRGIVACANEAGKADSNGSQFFITTERCDHLDRQNTIFGRVSGDTVFTVLRIQEVEVDDHDRPADPPTITSCEVLLPPFDDIVPRITPEERRAKAAAAVEAKRLAEVRERKQHGKRLNVLSFGDDAEEDEEDEPDAAAVRFRSAHETLQEDAMLKQASVGVHDEHVAQLQQRLAAEKNSQVEKDGAAIAAAAVEANHDEHDVDAADEFAATMRAKVKGKSGYRREEGSSASYIVPRADHENQAAQVGSMADDAGNQATLGGATEDASEPTDSKGSGFISDHQKIVAQYKRQKFTREERQADTLSKLKEFKSRLKDARSGASRDDAVMQATPASAADNAAYDGKIDSYLNESDEEEPENLAALATHRMVWKAHDGVADPTARRESIDDYKVVDPLIEAGKAAFNLKSQKAKKREHFDDLAEHEEELAAHKAADGQEQSLGSRGQCGTLMVVGPVVALFNI